MHAGYDIAVLAAILIAMAVRYHASTKRFTLQSTVFIATFSPCPLRHQQLYSLYKRLFGYLKQYWQLFALSLLWR